MVFRHRLYAVLAMLGVASLRLPLWALPPCGAPGTITTVTALDGDYLAAFSDYTIHPPVEYGTVLGLIDLVSAPEYRSYYPQALALDPQGRIYVADQTIIYRLEADGTATRIVGVPQYSIFHNEDDYDYASHPLGYDELHTSQPPVLQRFNVLADTVAALDARIAPGAMAFDRHGRLYFVDYVNRRRTEERLPTLVRIARLDADGQVVTFAGPAPFGYTGSLVFDREGHLLVAGDGGIRRIDGQGIISPLVEADQIWALVMDGQGGLYFTMDNQVFRRTADGGIEHVAGSGEDRFVGEEFDGKWRRRFGAEGRPATEAVLDFPASLAIDAQGSLYIANYYFHRIHRVGPDGLIETIAGNGLDSSFSLGCNNAPKEVAEHCRDHIGDGGPALEAPIWHPERLLLTPAGDLLVTMPVESIMGWTGGVFSHLRRICGVSERGVPTAVEAVETQASASLAEEAFPALRLYPNPFNAAVTVAFDLAHSASVAVRICNELGQQVRVLAAEERRPAGSYQFVWDGRDETGQFQASGTYLLVFLVDGAIETHKLTLLH